MSRSSSIITTVLGVLALTSCAAEQPTQPVDLRPDDAHGTHARLVEPSAELNRDLARLRRATAQFHDIEAARAAGYAVLFDPDGDGPGSACLSQENAAMGEHYVHPGLLFDEGALDVAAPEALIYEPTSDGRHRLVGVEFVVPFSDVPPSAPAPVLFGQEFMPNDNPGFHLWALHVWAWKDNPDGIFTAWNANVTCGYSTN